MSVPRLGSPFWTPPTSRGGMLAYFNTICADHRFPAIIENVPASEVENVANIMQVVLDDANTKQFRSRIAVSRIVNRICNRCHNKSKPQDLLWCSRCKMTFYCSTKCQHDDWVEHKKWCCCTNAEVDKGPQRTVIMRRPD